MHSTRKVLIGLSLALTMSLGAIGTAFGGPTLGVDINPGGTAFVNGNFTIGWGFTTTQEIFVTSLGYWDEGSNGLLSNHPVGLWTGAGSLLAQTTVTNASPIVVASGSGEGSWIFQPLGTVLDLLPGTYKVGGLIDANNQDPFRTFVPTIVVNSPLTNFISGQYAPGGSALAFPTQTENSGFSLFGPNFQFIGAATTATPEPTTIVSLSLGLIVGAVTLRRRRSAA